ncbi:MAG: phosphohydrolase [Clostridia bacterium]
MGLSEQQLLFFKDSLDEICKVDRVLQMGSFTQHGNVSCLHHSISVAYVSYAVAIKFHLKVNLKSLIKGALLHDFFLYDWETEKLNPMRHLRIHPHIALENASAYFSISDVERDIIVKHMWPIGLGIPRYLESFIVNIADTSCAAFEFMHVFSSFKGLAKVLN